MRITLVTAGSRGDLDPYLALGRSLLAAGHQVRLASTPEHAGRAREHRLEFFAFRDSLATLAATPAGQDASDPGPGLRRWLPRLRRVVRGHRGYFRGVLADCWLACQGSDLAVASPFGFGVPHAAEKLGIPCAWGLLQPLHPTRAFPILLAPHLRGPALLNRLSYRVAARIAWLLLGGLVEDFRRRLGLPPARRRPLLQRASTGRLPALYAFSPALVPPPADWDPERIAVTGYWFLDGAAGWRPPAGLEEFLAAGSPPVYFGVNGLRPGDRERFAAVAAAACARTGRRAVLRVPDAAGAGSLSGADKNLFLLDTAPHSWLLPRMAAAVHHGGAGTTAAALRAGIPSLVVPFAFDQYFWGARVATAGLGPRPLPARDLELAPLLDRLAELDSGPMRERAAAAGRRLAAEDGVGAAVARLERIAAAHTGHQGPWCGHLETG